MLLRAAKRVWGANLQNCGKGQARKDIVAELQTGRILNEGVQARKPLKVID